MVLKVCRPLIKYLEKKTKTLGNFISIKWVRKPKKNSHFKQRQQPLKQRLHRWHQTLVNKTTINRQVLALLYLLRGLATGIMCVHEHTRTPTHPWISAQPMLTKCRQNTQHCEVYNKDFTEGEDQKSLFPKVLSWSLKKRDKPTQGSSAGGWVH